jgi:hypothetical protein
MDMKPPKAPKTSFESTPSTPVSPPTHSTDVNLSPTTSDMSPSSPDSPTSIQTYLVNELNSLKRKNLTQENTVAWLIQEVIKAKKEIDDLKRTVKQLSSDSDEVKRRQALDIIGIRQQQMQGSYVREQPSPYQQQISQPSQQQQIQHQHQHHVAQTLHHAPHNPLPQILSQSHTIQQGSVMHGAEAAYGFPQDQFNQPGSHGSAHVISESEADQYLFGHHQSMTQSGQLHPDGMFY